MNEENDALAPREPDEIQRSGVEAFTQQLGAFLKSLDLPAHGVLVPVDERRVVMGNLPNVVARLTDEARRDALYVSKFVAACGVGLFDAALNFLWDETVASLRTKVARFDLAYFYESVFADPDRRKEFETEEDLVQLDDQQLINGCRNIGILSDIGYRHLNYIRDMRNWASAAHPNQVELTGLQLVGWLDTCVREVLGREPSAPAIEVRQLLRNVRAQTLAQADVAPIAARIPDLPPEIVASLLRALAGMFADLGMAADAKNNIRLIARVVWEQAPDQARREVGLKYSRFAANADIQRRDAVREFLTIVGGLGYLTPDALALEIAERVQALENAHLGMNNFYNEPAPARALAASIPETGAIPDVVRPDYVRVLTLAYIGNPFGISWAAEPLYQRLIARFGESEIRQFVHLLQDGTVSSRLLYSAPPRRFAELARTLRERTADPYTQRVLDLIIEATPEQLPTLGRATAFKEALQQLDRPVPRP